MSDKVNMKNQLTIYIHGKRNSGKTTLLLLIEKLLTEKGYAAHAIIETDSIFIENGKPRKVIS